VPASSLLGSDVTWGDMQVGCLQVSMGEIEN
jgi:hypothetical protein